MTLTEAAVKLQQSLDTEYGELLFTVLTDCIDTVFVCEHKRGFAKLRVVPDWFPKELKLIQQYTGKRP